MNVTIGSMPKREIKKPRPPLPIVARNLKRFREDRGWSQDELMARSGSPSVKMIESGKQGARVDTFEKIAEALDVTLTELFSDPASPMTPELEAFLRTPDGRTVTGAEIEQLKLIRARGHRPTSDTYFWALKMLRSMERKPD